MKSPVTGKEMSMTWEENTIRYKDIEVTYMHEAFYDADMNEYWTTTELDEGNLERLKEAYNKLK